MSCYGSWFMLHCWDESMDLDVYASPQLQYDFAEVRETNVSSSVTFLFLNHVGCR